MFGTAGRAHSIAIRLALMFAVFSLVVLTVLGVGFRYVLQREMTYYQQLDVQGRLEDIDYLLVHSQSPRLAQFVHDKLDSLSATDPYVRFWMWSADPDWRYGDGAESLARRIQQPRQSGRLLYLPPDASGRSTAVLGVARPANPMHPALVLMVGSTNPSFGNIWRTMDVWRVLLSLTGVVLVSAFAYWIARVGLKPLGRMSADAQTIGPDSRGRRLALSPMPLSRELLDLGLSFNAALDRLDGAYRQLETFNADVAHELRTPLTNLIGQTQVALSRQRDAAALREVLQSNLEDLERLRAIVADMLFLARAEQGERAFQRTGTSIAAEVGKTIEFFDALLEETGMHVSVQGDARAPIEAALFRRALTNLLQNAIQHSPPGADIDVRITSDPGSATVAFSNPGGPIAPEHLPHLFDRFYRIDAARRNNSGESNGLGLSIVKAVAAMHEGKAFARSEDGIVTVGFSVAL